MWSSTADRRRGGRTSSRLFATYAAASLVPVMALGAVLMHGLRADAAATGRDQGLAQAAVIAEMAIAPALNGADLDAGLTTEQRDRMHSATDLAIYHGSVKRLRLRSFAGRVIFSDDGSTAGGISVSDPAFRTASAGGTAADVIDGGEGPVIRVLQPVIANAAGQAVGVLEIYLPYEAIAEHLQQQMTQTYWRLGAGLAALYLVLALLAWSTTRSLGRYAARQEHEALHDGLTGLPNRAAFRTRVKEALADRDRGAGAVVLIDLNRFKEVNDTLGHHAGDELLQVVAERLTAGLRGAGTPARLGGDEFGLIMPGLAEAEVVERLEAVRERLTEEVVLDGVPLSIEASYGIALYPQHGVELEELLQHADAAMYQGKRGAADIVVFSGAQVAHPTQWLVVQAELRHALERDELRLLYQPKIDLVNGEICALEALVRWQHPQRGLLPPSEFLPAAEHSGLIEPLTAWVLRRALDDLVAWTATGQQWSVSVNVSARNLESPGFPQSVVAALAERGVPTRSLHLEVTETALAGDAQSMVRSILELGRHGIGISIDDFGIGYTSLSHLRGLRIAEIKIDRAFVGDLDSDEQNRAIVRSVIGLAHGLGSRVTAEGVETPEVCRWLAEAGCDEAQGYLFSRPVAWPHVLDQFHRVRTTLPAARPAPAVSQPEGVTR